MAYYSREYLTATYDDELDAVVMQWHDFAEGEEFRDGLDAGLELVEREGAPNWLADLRDMGTVTDADQRWSNEDWFPRALGTSLSRMAIIKPESVVANMSVESVIQEVDDGSLTTHYFDNRADAGEWLQDETASPTA
jgi:hypothetical protein